MPFQCALIALVIAISCPRPMPFQCALIALVIAISCLRPMPFQCAFGDDGNTWNAPNNGEVA